MSRYNNHNHKNNNNRKNSPLYGQVVSGPPGSGKTTYCAGMQDYLRLLGRNAWVINLDPANEVPKNPPKSFAGVQRGQQQQQQEQEQQQQQQFAGESKNTSTQHKHDDNDDEETKKSLPYDTLLDVCDSVINLSSVMKKLGLGPNGGLLYCMEYLDAHIDDVVELIHEQILDKQTNYDNDDKNKNNNNNNDPNRDNYQNQLPYLIFDLPGQVELYTHGTAVPCMIQKLVDLLDLRLVAVQLIDAHYCTEPANFLSAALLGTTTMLRLELPAVNILSKVDLLVNYGPLNFSLDYFTNCQELERLVPFLHGGGDGSNNNNDYDYDYDGYGDNDYDDYYNNNHNNNNNRSNNDRINSRTDTSSTFHHDEFHYADDPDYQRARKITRSSPFFRNHEKLHKVLAEVVDEFGLLSFLPLDISSAESVGHVVSKIDKCNGYVFRTSGANHPSSTSSSTSTSKIQDLFQCAINNESTMTTEYEIVSNIQERLDSARQQQKNKNKKEKEKKQGKGSQKIMK